MQDPSVPAGATTGRAPSGPPGGGLPLDPGLAAIVAAAAQDMRHTQTIEQIRADVGRYFDAAVIEQVARVEDRMIDLPQGPLRVRVYTPDEPGARPLAMFFHGSGFCFLGIETHDAMCRQICRRSGAVVVSVEYRLAPEHRYPAAPDDCHAATCWAVRNAAALGANPRRVAVVGDSAGGNLAAVVAQRTKAAGGPDIAAQVLLYPVLDHYSVERPSWRERETGFGLTAAGMRWFWDQYLEDPADGALPDVSPLRAAELAGLPKAYIATAEYDVLRDEGDAYADALRAAGVEVAHVRHPDLNHGHLFWVGRVGRAMAAMDHLGRWMRNEI